MYFKGAYFDYDGDKLDLKDNPTLAAHFIHSIIWLRYRQGGLQYQKGMTVAQFKIENKSFLEYIVYRYEKERKYALSMTSIDTGIGWYLRLMEMIYNKK